MKRGEKRGFAETKLFSTWNRGVNLFRLIAKGRKNYYDV